MHHLTVIAEGIERERERLKGLGISLIDGENYHVNMDWMGSGLNSLSLPDNL